MARRVLVIGGAGYVGSVLTPELLQAGFEVRVLDALLYGTGASLAPLVGTPGFEFRQGDLRSAEDVEGVLEGVTDVVLLASLVGDPISKAYPELTRSVNLDGSRRLFEQLDGRGLDRFVFTSTCSNYGLRDTAEPAREDAPLRPQSLYAETKVALEEHVLSRAPGVDLCPVILRLATAFGISPRMRFDLTVSEFTRTLVLGRPLEVYDARTWRPYCHVRDISRAVRAVLEAPAEQVRGAVFNVGADANNHTKQEIVDAALEVARGAEVRYRERGADPRNYRVDFGAIREALGFEAEHRVPEAIARLASAIRQGLYDDVEERRRFYGNHEILGPARGAAE